MIKTESLTFRYPKGDEDFHFPDIHLSSEEDLLILGKSGKGKTTLLHLLAGLLQPVSGQIVIGETNTSTLSARALDAFRGRQIGLVFQNNHAVQSLTVFKNLQARLFFSKKGGNEGTINELLKELGLSELKDRKTKTLSEGQLQRLGIAMAVVHGPKVILADEPTSSLDDENCQIVIDLLKKQAAKNGANLIVITHDNRVKPFFQKSITL
ncbi:MAG: ABC transporter ATP-binding protein [Flavobacteriaceae bacterium]|nr:ABC transporter ATP-binding protein [Flavobacteriaceae bacterium]|tara:strand:+ start:6314 stop:6943 length:630 start_codon:yes stop_codon:yes gene_type:complete